MIGAVLVMMTRKEIYSVVIMKKVLIVMIKQKEVEVAI